MFVYGGPGNQTVTNSYDAFRGMWFQMLANELDIIVASVDNHGTDGRSEEFKKSTYGQMGKLETRDQTEAALELAKRLVHQWRSNRRLWLELWRLYGVQLFVPEPRSLQNGHCRGARDELAIL